MMNQLKYSIFFYSLYIPGFKKKTKKQKKTDNVTILQNTNRTVFGSGTLYQSLREESIRLRSIVAFVSIMARNQRTWIQKTRIILITGQYNY